MKTCRSRTFSVVVASQAAPATVILSVPSMTAPVPNEGGFTKSGARRSGVYKRWPRSPLMPRPMS
jgi:hypothetical protein